jgi:hypothetical protein
VVKHCLEVVVVEALIDAQPFVLGPEQSRQTLESGVPTWVALRSAVLGDRPSDKEPPRLQACALRVPDLVETQMALLVQV